MYGLTAASMASGVGVPVMMAANVGSMISDDNMTFNKDQHDAKMKKMSGQKKRPQAKPNKAKTKKVPLISIKYDKKCRMRKTVEPSPKMSQTGLERQKSGKWAFFASLSFA